MIINNREITLGVSSLHYEWETLEDACRIAHEEFGMDLIEFSHSRGGYKQSVDTDDLPVIHKLRKDYGGKIDVSLHVWFDITADKSLLSIEKMRRTAKFADESGARYVIAHMGTHPDRKIGLQILKDVILETLPRFESARAVLCLENHYPYDYEGLNELGGTPEDFLEIFESAASPYLGFCLDYGHSHMSSNTLEFIEKLSPHLKYTHLADNAGNRDSHLPLGEGTVDWEEVLGQTLNSGFNGPFVVEYPANVDTVNVCAALFREIVLRRESGHDNI